jgi:hypothetical protein
MALFSLQQAKEVTPAGISMSMAHAEDLRRALFTGTGEALPYGAGRWTVSYRGWACCQDMNSQFHATPTHTMRLDGPSDWPLPPFASRDPWGQEDGPSTPVRIQTLRGFDVDGEMLGFDAKNTSLIFRLSDQGSALRVQFHRFRKLTLSAPLADDDAGTAARITFASQLRKFKIALTGDGKLSGRTAGHVETRLGLFLFTPDDDECSLQRSFVPAGAYTRCVLGPSVEEDAAMRWINSPTALFAALEETQSRRKVIAIGEAIYNLGVISARQLAVLLNDQGAARKVPIGEMLVSQGLLSRADLRTALGHKMGYPLVDLTNFPIQTEALEHVPPDAAFEFNALPLLLRNQQLVVAVDNLARVAQLESMPLLSGLRVFPALARQSHIEAALVRAYQNFGQSVWQAPPSVWGLTAPMAA